MKNETSKKDTEITSLKQDLAVTKNQVKQAKNETSKKDTEISSFKQALAVANNETTNRNTALATMTSRAETLAA